MSKLFIRIHSIMYRIFKLYSKYLNKYPIIFQSVQTGILMGLGDTIAQTVVENRPMRSHDFYRTLRFMAIGQFMVGPVLSKWYVFLDRFVGKQKMAPLKKVALDQMIMAPTLNGAIIIATEILQSHSVLDVENKLQANFKDILLANYKIWPFAQMINFYLVPLNYQTLFVQMVAISWNTYLSFKLQKSKEPS